MQERENLVRDKVIEETQNKFMGGWLEPEYREDSVIAAPLSRLERLGYLVFSVVVVGSPFIYDQLVEKFFSK